MPSITAQKYAPSESASALSSISPACWASTMHAA